MTILSNKDDWQELLHNYLLRRQNEAFKWGTMDCCLFACDAVLELTGVDLAAEFRGKYDSLRGAMDTMWKFLVNLPVDQLEKFELLGIAMDELHLVESVAHTIAVINGIEEVPLLMAQRGDVLLLDSPLGKGLGILGLRGTTAHCAGPDGVVDVPLQECLRAWRIPKFAPVPAEATI
jgi:hypothetical protein